MESDTDELGEGGAEARSRAAQPPGVPETGVQSDRRARVFNGRLLEAFPKPVTL